MVEVIKVTDLPALIERAAHDFVATVVAAQAPGGGVHGDGMARVVLTGGGAGIGLLRKLAELAQAAQAQQEDFPALAVDWQRVHVFFGDERNVPVTDPESNEGQARAALLAQVGVPEEHIHGYHLGKQDMAAAVTQAEADLAQYAPQGFDLHLLGMGGEGHINSLFPATAAVREQVKAVVAVTDSPKPPAERVTYTLPTVARANQVWLLVAGAEKATAAAHVVKGSPAEQWPAAGAHGKQATKLYLAADAATEL